MAILVRDRLRWLVPLHKVGKNKKKPKTKIDYTEKLIDFALGILEGAVLLILAKYIK